MTIAPPRRFFAAVAITGAIAFSRQAASQPRSAQEGPAAAAPAVSDPRPHRRDFFNVRSGEGYTMWTAYAGLRGSATRLHGADADGWAGGAAANGEGEFVSSHRESPLSASMRFRYRLGTGSSGLEGALGAGMTLGAWGNLGDTGPFLRAGADTFLFGNGKFYYSMVEIPRGEAGWTIMADWLVLEVGATAGLAAVGRFNAGDDGSRRLGGVPDMGSYVTAHVMPLRFHADATRVLAKRNGNASPIDVFSGALCLSLTVGHATLQGVAVPPVLHLCGDAMLMRGDVAFPNLGEQQTSVMSAGLSFGLGGAGSSSN